MCESTGARGACTCRLIVARVGECDRERGVRGDAGGQWVEQGGPAGPGRNRGGIARRSIT